MNWSSVWYEWELSVNICLTERGICRTYKCLKNFQQIYSIELLLLRPNSWTKFRQKSSEFSSLLFKVTSTALPWDFYFFKLMQPLLKNHRATTHCNIADCSKKTFLLTWSKLHVLYNYSIYCRHKSIICQRPLIITWQMASLCWYFRTIYGG